GEAFAVDLIGGHVGGGEAVQIEGAGFGAAWKAPQAGLVVGFGGNGGKGIDGTENGGVDAATHNTLRVGGQGRVGFLQARCQRSDQDVARRVGCDEAPHLGGGLGENEG